MFVRALSLGFTVVLRRRLVGVLVGRLVCKRFLLSLLRLTVGEKLVVYIHGKVGVEVKAGWKLFFGFTVFSCFTLGYKRGHELLHARGDAL